MNANWVKLTIEQQTKVRDLRKAAESWKRAIEKATKTRNTHKCFQRIIDCSLKMHGASELEKKDL